MRAQVLFRVTPIRVYIAESTETHAPAQFSLASATTRRSAAPCGAVRCRALRAVPCGAVLCRASQSVLFRAYQTATLASVQSWPKPACMYSSILYICSMLSSFSIVLDCNKHLRAVRMQQQTAVPQYVRTCTKYVVEPRAQQSTARHSSAITPAQRKIQVRANQITYKKKYVRVHACGVPFVFLEHGALGICKSPVCT